MSFWHLLASIPFIGKHKRVLGGALMAVGTLGPMVGLDVVEPLKDVGLLVTGLGLTHAGAKTKFNH